MHTRPHILTHTQTHANAHTHANTRSRSHTHTLKHTCTRCHTHTLSHVHAYAHTLKTHTLTHAHTHTHAHTQNTHAHAVTRTRCHTYAHTLTHIHAQMGVVEAIKASLSTLPQQSITLRYLLSGSGDITLSDVDLAAASGGLVLGFNLEVNDEVETHAKRQGVRLMTYKVCVCVVVYVARGVCV